MSIKIQDVAGEPAMVVSLEVPAAGTMEVPLELEVGDGTEYWLRRSSPVDGDTTSLPATWSSKIALKVAVPTNLTQAPGAVQVLPGTGVSEMKVSVGSTTVDLTGSLGPVEVNVGTSGAMSGVSQDPDDVTSTLVRAEGKVGVTGTSTTTGTTLTDAAIDLSKLYAATTTKAKRTSDSLECTATAASGTGLTCDLPDDTAAEPDVVKSWAVGDAYTLAYSSTTWLADTATDFVTKGVKVGDVVYTYTLADGERQKTGACQVATVAKHLVELLRSPHRDGTPTFAARYDVPHRAERPHVRGRQLRHRRRERQRRQERHGRLELHHRGDRRRLRGLPVRAHRGHRQPLGARRRLRDRGPGHVQGRVRLHLPRRHRRRGDRLPDRHDRQAQHRHRRAHLRRRHLRALLGAVGPHQADRRPAGRHVPGRAQGAGRGRRPTARSR